LRLRCGYWGVLGRFSGDAVVFRNRTNRPTGTIPDGVRSVPVEQSWLPAPVPDSIRSTTCLGSATFCGE